MISRCLRGQWWFSTDLNELKSQLLSSQFHRHGPRHFSKTKQLIKQQTNRHYQVEALVNALADHRAKLEDEPWVDNAQWRAYLKNYERVSDRMGELKRGGWVFRMAGWLNMLQFKQEMVGRLLGVEVREEHSGLVQSLGWMHPLTYDPQVSSPEDASLWNIKLAYFYKNLTLKQSVSLLRVIESLLKGYSTQHKQRYYANYAQTHYQNLIDSAQSGQQQFEDLLWFTETYVSASNDHPIVLSQFNQLLENTQLSEPLRHRVKSIFLKIGGISEIAYMKHFKAKLNEPEININDAVEGIEFIILSEANDEQTLGYLLGRVSSQFGLRRITQSRLIELHSYLHYLRITKPDLPIPPQLWTESVKVCRKQGNNQTLTAKLIYDLKDSDLASGKNSFICDCLIGQRGAEKSSAVPLKKIPQVSQYRDTRIFGAKIGVCAVSKEPGATVFERVYERRVPSRRLFRQQEVRDVILSHYGCKIKYLQLQSVMLSKQIKSGAEIL